MKVTAVLLHIWQRKKPVILDYFQVDVEILTFVLIYSLGLQVDFWRVQFWRARSYSSGWERHRLWNGIVDSFQTPWTVLLILLKQSPTPPKHVLNQKPDGICVCKDNNHHTEVTCMAKHGSKGTILQVILAFPARELCTQLASAYTAQVLQTGHRFLPTTGLRNRVWNDWCSEMCKPCKPLPLPTQRYTWHAWRTSQAVRAAQQQHKGIIKHSTGGNSWVSWGTDKTGNNNSVFAFFSSAVIAATLPFQEERTPSILVVSHPNFQWIMH